jgi:hypothetical protein
VQDEEQDALSTLTEWIKRCNEGIQWMVKYFAVEDKGVMIADAISQGTAIAVSNGSYKDEFGTLALVLEGKDSNNCILTVNVVPGDLDDQSSFWSELAGIFGIVTMATALCEVYSISEGSICVGCDREIALNHVFGEGAGCDADVNAIDYNMISTIRMAIQMSSIRWTY